MIVLGWDDDRFDPADVTPAAMAPYGATVQGGCTPCARTKRAVFDPPPKTGPNTFELTDDQKPSETYVFVFDEMAGATRWLNTHAVKLKNKKVYVIDPATD